MANVKVVTAYVPLHVLHLTSDQYHDYGRRLVDACDGRIRFFDNFPLEDCWLSKENPPMVPATPPAPDRYATPGDFVRSNIVQHSRTQWAMLALKEDPTIDVVLWLDLAILKQGAWNGHPVTEAHVKKFIDTVENWWDDAGRLFERPAIPFPGIEGPEAPEMRPHGNNWRFCGSTHIWPTNQLPAIDVWYKSLCKQFITTYKCTPLDLAIWPMVEKISPLPFVWYKAEYDSTQLENFPYA